MATPVYSRIVPSEHAIGKPVTQSLMDRLRRNPLAILGVDEDDETGAPRIPVPQSLVTTETDPTLSLYAAGSGGVRWGRLTQDYRTGGNDGIPNLNAGAWMVHAIASQPGFQDELPHTWHGMALVAQGQLLVNSAVQHDAGSTAGFLLDDGTLRFLPNLLDDFLRPITRTLMALRIA